MEILYRVLFQYKRKKKIGKRNEEFNEPDGQNFS